MTLTALTAVVTTAASTNNISDILGLGNDLTKDKKRFPHKSVRTEEASWMRGET